MRYTLFKTNKDFLSNSHEKDLTFSTYSGDMRKAQLALACETEILPCICSQSGNSAGIPRRKKGKNPRVQIEQDNARQFAHCLLPKIVAYKAHNLSVLPKGGVGFQLELFAWHHSRSGCEKLERLKPTN